jgi:hypothetical protein
MKKTVPTWSPPYFLVERLAEDPGKDDINSLETRCASRSKDRVVAWNMSDRLLCCIRCLLTMLFTSRLKKDTARDAACGELVRVAVHSIRDRMRSHIHLKRMHLG